MGEKIVGCGHPDVARRRYNRAGLLQKLVKMVTHEFASLLIYGSRGWSALLESSRPLCHEQGNCKDANRLYRRAIAIGEASIGSGHPKILIAPMLHGLATLLHGQVSDDIALNWHTNLIHPTTSHLLLAMCMKQGENEDADSLYARAIEIGDGSPGPPDPEMVRWLNNRALLLVKRVREDVMLYSLAESEL